MNANIQTQPEKEFDPQEKVWMEIIVRMEQLYAHLADSQTEMEQQTKELEKTNAELREYQAELVEAAKMSSLGRLAAGVAHELNNPLGGIMLYADLVLEDMDEDDPHRKTIQKISKQTRRCRNIVKDLLDFARPDKSAVPRPVNVNYVLRDSIKILEGQQLFHNIEVEKKLRSGVPQILGDPGRLQQAFVNLILNSAEAMEDGGILTLESQPSGDNNAAVVSIADTGCGIAQEDIDHLFEPFFTTRKNGTGLGLPIAYRIIETHNGSISVDSRTGCGTSFTLHIRSMDSGNDYVTYESDVKKR